MYLNLFFCFQVPLSVEDIEMILDLTVYDGKVEKSIGTDLSKRYRAIEPLLPAPGIVRTPCGVCPVSNFYLKIFPCLSK